MKEQAYTTLSLKLDKQKFSYFFPLLQQGVFVKTQVGYSIKELLCEQFKVDADYLAERIKTIFLDSKPVDDVETAVVKDSSVIALSAAMPGLVGATFRRGGVLASFRSGITYQGEGASSDTHELGMVKIKLFNILAEELGHVFLKHGIWMKKEDIAGFLKDKAGILQFIKHAEKGGQEIPPEQMACLNWSEEPENVLLRVLISELSS